MRAGPTPSEAKGHQNSASNRLAFRRCNFAGRLRRLGSLPLASRGFEEPARRCLASRAATASPEHPLDSSGIARILVHGQSSAGEEFPLRPDGLPSLAPAGAVSPPAGAPAGQQPAPAQPAPPDTLPWREGVTDHSLEASTSGVAGGSCGSPFGSRGEAAAALDGGARRRCSTHQVGRDGGGGGGGSTTAVPRGRLHRRQTVSQLLQRHRRAVTQPRQSADRDPDNDEDGEHGPGGPLPGPETQGAEISIHLRTSGADSRSAGAGAGEAAVDIAGSVARWLDRSGPAGAAPDLRQWLLAAFNGDVLRGGQPERQSWAGDVVHAQEGRAGESRAAAEEGEKAEPGELPPASVSSTPVDVELAKRTGRMDHDPRVEPVAASGAAGQPTRGEGTTVPTLEPGAAGPAVGAAAAVPLATATAVAAKDEDGDAQWGFDEGLFGLEPLSEPEGGGPTAMSAGPTQMDPQRTANLTAAEPAAALEAVAANAALAAKTTLAEPDGGSPGLYAVTSLGDSAAEVLPDWPSINVTAVARSCCHRPSDVRLSGPPLRRPAINSSSSSSRNGSASGIEPGSSSRSRSSGTHSRTHRVATSKDHSRAGRAAAAAGESGGSRRGKAPEGSAPADGSASASGSESRSELLTRELCHAADWRRVAVLVQMYDKQLDCIHVSAALVRLAKLHRRDSRALTALAETGAAAASGSTTKGSSMVSGASRVAWARLRAKSRAKALGLKGAQQHWLDVLKERRLRRLMTEQNPGGIRMWQSPPPPAVPAAAAVAASGTAASVGASTARALTHGSDAVLHPDVARLLDSLLALIPGLMPRADCRTVSNMLWALGVLQPLTRERHRSGGAAAAAAAVKYGVPRVTSTAKVLAAKVRHFWTEAEPQSLALVLWGLARLRLRPGPVWMGEFEYASLRLMPRFGAQELSCSLWALAAMRLRPDALWLSAARRTAAAAALGTRPAAAATTANLRSIATLLWAFAVLKVRLEDDDATAMLSSLTAALERAAGGGGGGGAQALSMALWGCARQGLRPSSELLAAWRRAASGPTLAAAPARAVACMLWSLARLRCAPPGPWVDEAAAALLARAREGALGRQGLCLTVHSLAQLDSRVSTDWLRAFSEAATPLVRHLDPSELGVVLHSLGRLAPAGSGRGGGGGGADGRRRRGGGGGAADCLAAEFVAAADVAAAAALPAATAKDVAGIGGGLAALGVARSLDLHVSFVRQVGRLARAGELTSGQAAGCLEYLAVSGRQPVRCPAAPAAAAAMAGSSGSGDAAAAAAAATAGLDVSDGARELCYDTVHADVPAQTKQPLPPPQPPPPPLPPHGLVLELLLVVLTSDVDQYDILDVGRALSAAAELGVVATTAEAQKAVASTAARVCGHAPGARPVLRLLQGMYGMRVRPNVAWLSRLAAQIGGRLRTLDGEELELLLRLLGALQNSSRLLQPASTWQQQRPPRPSSAVEALLSAAQPTLASAPVQHLLQLATALVAATTTTGNASATVGVPASPSPSPPAVTQLRLPPGWMLAFEHATAPKLSLLCMSAANLVELLACIACLGHTPGADWAAAWYDSTARRLRSLGPSHLCMALHLQHRLGLRPPLEWLRAYAAALASAAGPAPQPGGTAEQRRQVPPLEVLAAVAELQRLGLDDSTLASAAPSAPSLSGLVAAATAALHHQMLAAEPPAQLATLAALHAIAESRVAPPAPHAGGWAVGAVAMAHSVIVERPLHQFLAGLQAPPSAAADDCTSANAGTSSELIVRLLGSMARWGHAPNHRWLAGIARHVCRHAESAAGGGAVAGGAAGWSADAAARAVCCLAALGFVPEAALAERLQRLLQPALAATTVDGTGGGGLQPALAAELCAAWATVRRPPSPGWWQAVEVGALAPASLAQLAPAALVRLPYSMTTLGHVPSYEWLSRYLPNLPAALTAVASCAGAATTSPVSSTAAASCSGTTGTTGTTVSTVSTSSTNSTSSISSTSSTSSTTDTPTTAAMPASSGRAAADLANLAWALGSAVHAGGYPPAVLSMTGALQALLMVSEPLLASMGPGQLVLLVEGLARVRHRLPPDWVQAFVGQVVRQLSACGPSDLVSFLYCLAFLDATLPVPWLAAALQRTAQLLPPLLRSAEAYRADDLAWAVAKLDPRGTLAAPFLELLRRQRLLAAGAPQPQPPAPPAWFLRSIAADDADGSGRGSDAAGSDSEQPRVGGRASGRGRRRASRSRTTTLSSADVNGAATDADFTGACDQSGVEDLANSGDAGESDPPSPSGTGSHGQVGRGRRVLTTRPGYVRPSRLLSSRRSS